MADERDQKFLDQLMDRLSTVLIAHSDRQLDGLAKVMNRMLKRQLEASAGALEHATNRKSDAVAGAIGVLSEQIARIEREVAALREERGTTGPLQ